MKKDEAIKIMKQIEKNIKKLKKNGYSVFCVDSEMLVLESKKLRNINDELTNKAAINGTSGYGKAIWTPPDVDVDYEIQLN
jgi:cell division GTPase FtsZ